MKRLISPVIIFLLVITCLCLPAQAVSPLPYVDDQAGLLTEEQKVQLENLAENASLEQNCGIYIVTLEDFKQLGSGDFVLIEDALDWYYDEMNYGLGEDRSAAILMLSMKERDFSFLCFGLAYQKFTDWDLDQITYSFLDDFSNNAWYNGFTDYIETTNLCLESAGEGGNMAPVDPPHVPVETEDASRIGQTLVGLIASLVISAIVAAVVHGKFLQQMRSVYAKPDAEGFVSKDGLVLKVRSDDFSHTKTTRVYIPPASSRSSSGSSYRSSFRSSGIRSSGRSGRSSGRSGKF